MEGFGVRVRPFSEGRPLTSRPRNVIYGGRTMKRLWLSDERLASVVVTCIQKSDARCFDDYTILAVWNFIGAHFAQNEQPDAIAAFGRIDIAKISRRAHRLAKGRNGRMGKVTEKISSLLAHAIIPEDEAA
ncbi:MAG: hypothetical protein PGN22_02685 [Agrobacterium cavarae]